MNQEKLLKFIETENEAIKNIAQQHAAVSMVDSIDRNCELLEKICEKALMIEHILKCRKLPLGEIRTSAMAFEAKEKALLLFDEKELIRELILAE